MKLDEIEEMLEHAFYIVYYAMLIVFLGVFYVGVVWMPEALFERIDLFKWFIIAIFFFAGTFSIGKVIISGLTERLKDKHK